MAENKSLRAVEEFTQTMKMVGIEKTIAALQNARSVNKDKDLHIAFIIKMVCTHCNVLFDDVVNYTGYGDDMLYPKAFMIFYLDKEFEVSWADLRILFKRDQSSLFKSAKRVKNLDEKLPPHKRWCLAKTDFDLAIKKYKKQTK